MKIRRALVSVFDKKNVLPFAKQLRELGVEILSTGGTADLFKKEGIEVKDVAEVTRFPEMLNGRVKTLHPAIHGGILALRDNSKHLETLAEHNIKPIDLVAVNLYAFAEAARTKTDEAEIIEMIDIGGPSMLRSAAKNWRFVVVLSDPADYEPVLNELRSTGGVSLETRRKLAGKVFTLTAAYDRMISDYFSGRSSKASANGGLPETIELAFQKETGLRYGENPHQPAGLYRDGAIGGIVSAKKLQGKELSFNNILDLDAAYEMVSAFPPKADPPTAGDKCACAIVKHTSPCGFALGKNPAEAFKRAHACDPLSAFGGIIGFNCEVDGSAAKTIIKSGFLECVVAPSFTPEALEAFAAKKNVRLVAPAAPHKPGLEFRKVSGGLLVQEADILDPKASDLRWVTKTKPKASDIADLLFAFKACRYAKSNAIVIAKGGAVVGLGMGQPSRVDSCLTAFRKAGKKAKGAVLASDGFFPKPDSIALARKHGIRAIIQPGGSIQDEDVIRACDKAKIAMAFTGVRHFRH